MPLSETDRRKKDILALDYEEYQQLVAIMLHGFEVGVYDLYLTTKTLNGYRSSTRVENLVAKLVETELVYTTWRTVAVAQAYRAPLIFAADHLRQGQLAVLIKAVQDIRNFPSGDSAYTKFGRRYSDIAIRCIHKLLENKPREFITLYRTLEDRSPYLEYERTTALHTVNEAIGTLDWPFFASRAQYFQDRLWLSLQTSYPTWGEGGVARINALFQTAYRTDTALAETSRAILLLAFHFYLGHPELYSEDADLRLVSDLAAARPIAPAPAPTERSEDEPAGFVEVVRTAYEYGRGELSKEQLTARVSTFKLSNYPALINSFIAYQLVETGRDEEGENLLVAQIKTPEKHPLDWLVILWCAGWMGFKLRTTQLDALTRVLTEGGYENIPWVEGEILSVLKRVARHAHQKLPAEILARTPVQSSNLYAILPEKPMWAYALRQLRKATAGAGEENGEPDFQTIWVIDFDDREIYCKEQKMGKRGWTKGRKLKWGELIRPQPQSNLEAADKRAVAGLTLYDGKPLNASMYYTDDMIYPSFGRLLYEIADHPRIYLGEKKRIPVQLNRAEAELQVTETPEGILLRFDPPVETGGYVWRKETPTRYNVYHLTEEQARMAFSIGEGIEIPAAEREQLETIVEDIRPSVNVQSTFDLIDEDLETIHGSSKPCFHLLPFGDGYQVELYAKPLATEAFYFKPGEGLPRSIIVLENGRHLLERPLKQEVDEAAAAILACPTLARSPQENYEWVIDDTQTALRILLELRKLILEDQATIEHPKGEKLRIAGVAGQDELSIRVGKSRDWFEVDGQLTVDEQKVADLALLFEHLKNQRDNPFIELGDGEFLAITDELRDKVLEMEGLLHDRNGKMSLPTLAAGAFAEVAADLQEVEFDDDWQTAVDRIRSAASLRPRIPKHFNAELRDYQKDGYRWMMRLAAWGVGGCLADDMGLGKTVQALALLTARSDAGPSLVIAPASVTRNWLREIERFAPGLVPVLIASSGETSLLPELGAGDVALVSYGLLPFIGEALGEVMWGNIVIDEAQAIKNAATKRAQIVQKLNADFKLATTGTPIENHLGELWSLFRFLNPGLLGSKAAFNEMYNRPIAQNNDEERRLALKNIVKPFILRRRKDEVLTELPPKTEIILSVDLSEEEKALYEAMRRHALKEIAAADEQQKRFTVLAQLTKLRQAACHPRLVRPNSKVGSAKLELVGDTLLEILENGHKALIFSQFVKHLKIVENWVRGQGISYQYLDGSTPGKKREEAVNAFQGGEGEVFLISLKAGGTGLNLTEADYVLHLDPWWNPAAEDQASDRAHRIGQQRPVTVYRFVSEGTIEEQIIALHNEKRDLADQILSGTGKAGALGVDEILTLITQPKS